MRRPLAVALALALSGCATVGETMATKEPSAILTTAKTPAAYRDCIVLASEFTEFTASEFEGGYIFVHSKAPGQVFTVKPSGHGSEVRVWGLLGTRRTARHCL